ncbi:hypothetical protein V5O39_26330 [Pseudomonas parakoreensis]
MAIDPSKFHKINVADTCSVWNILSSRRLYAAAQEAKCEFCMTGFVLYECLVKPRTAATEADLELRERLKQEQTKGKFASHSCSIDDLQAIAALESRKNSEKASCRQSPSQAESAKPSSLMIARPELSQKVLLKR